jgi:hypothetical protein
MNRFFEKDINDDFRKAILTQNALLIFMFSLSICSAITERSIFSFSYFIELTFLVWGSVFYYKAQRNRNYAYWTISLGILVYLLLDILQSTFVTGNMFILYLAFIAFIFLILNCYTMSSPLFYPRVQWWEYDYQFRADLKALIRYDGSVMKARLTDYRRYSACVECFDFIPLDSEIFVEVDFDDQNFLLKGKVKTYKGVIAGRPFRYGVRFTFDEVITKNVYLKLLKIWKNNKQVRLRSKFDKNDTK